MVSDGEGLAILSVGHPGNFVQQAIAMAIQEGYTRPAHYDLRFVKPLDQELLHHVFQKFQHIITVEDGVISGGFGSAVIEFMTDQKYHSNVLRLGVPDRFIEHGALSELYRECGFDAKGILAVIKQFAVKPVFKAVIQ